MAEKKPVILVVDDEDLNLQLLESMLIPQGYTVIKGRDGEEAVELAKSALPDVILLDIMMPKINGFEAARLLKENSETSIIPVVMVTGLSDVKDRIKALEVGADDFLTKPVDATELRARIRSLLKVKAYNDHMRNYQAELKVEVAKKTEELQKAFQQIKSGYLDTIYRLSLAAEFKDEDTGAHIKRMAHFATAIAKQMGLGETTVETILYAAPMHDIGKIGVPDNILLKPGKLDSDEWVIMKQHTTFGAKILEGSDDEFLKLAEIIALSHHEKWDGSGYPKGLKGTEIPVPGHITAVADVFDALTTERPYKKAFSLEKSFGIIEKSSGTHFNPEIVDIFFAIKDEILSIKETYKDEKESLLFKMAREKS